MRPTSLLREFEILSGAPSASAFAWPFTKTPECPDFESGMNGQGKKAMSPGIAEQGRTLQL
jgi:hypothetical protein